MENEPLLMIPGPVPVPERVRMAMLRQAINHRGPEFGSIYAESVRVLKGLFHTGNELFILSGSGTAAMEAAIGNFGRDRRIVSLVNGKFGERMGKIGQRYGDVTVIGSDWGAPLDLDGLERALEEGAELVTMVHNETSSGIKNPAAAIGKLTRKHDALFVMDGITSIGGDLVEVDDWGVDVAFVGSQKCLAAPAGLSAISVSKKAWERLSEKRPYYLDLAAYRKSAASTPMETPYTPAVPLFLALHEALAIVEKEGLEKMIESVRFDDLSERYFDRSIVPDDWYSPSDIISRMEKRSDYRNILAVLFDVMNGAKDDSLIIIDSITDVATQHDIPNLWSDLVGFLRGFQRIAKRKNITIYLLLSKGVLGMAKELELADMADAVLLFRWEETTGARRQRVMYFEKFRGVMPHLEERDLVKFAVRITTSGGFEVSNIRVII